MMTRIRSVLSNKTVMLRIAITLFIIVIFRIASHIPIPLLNVDLFASQSGFGEGFLGILNSYSGQALSRFSVMSLGISPFITSSIVVQLLKTVLPAMKEWDEEGESGKQKIARLTRYLAIALAFIQALLLVLGVGVRGSQLQHGVDHHIFVYIYMAIVITAGSSITIWFADLITSKGIGNGTSILITAGIITSIPIMIDTLNSKYLSVGGAGNIAMYSFIILFYLLIIIGIVYMQIATRKVPVQYANRQGRTDSNIPIKINSAGVLPVIFASTLMSIPMTIIGFTSSNQTTGSAAWINQIFNSQQPIGFMLYIMLIIVFSFFYTFMIMNPTKMADNLSKNGSFIPGIRPGDDTKNYLARLIFKITVVGTIYLALIAALPIIMSWVLGFTAAEASSITIGGTGLLIVVGVAVETTKQIETSAEQDEYTGLLD